MLWNVKIKYEGSTEYKESVVCSDGPLKLDTKDIRSSIVNRLTYTSKSKSHPPHLVVLNDKKYIIPDWIEVHPLTTFDDIIWNKPSEKPIEEKTFKFESSSEKGMFYKVRVIGSRVSCTCPGVWRSKDRSCKHMKQVKQELGL